MKTVENDFEIKIICKNENVAALEIENSDEHFDDLVIAAYGDGKTPSLILQNRQTKEFFHIGFGGFDNFEVWASELNGDSLKVCLIKIKKGIK